MFFFLLSGPALATVIYDESVSGDLSDQSTTLLTLQMGVNRVLGSVQTIQQYPDFDSFSVSIGQNLTLTTIDFHITNLMKDVDTTILASAYGLFEENNPGNMLALSNISLLGNQQQSMFGSGLPLTGINNYRIRNLSVTRDGGGGNWDYEMVFTVNSSAPVPEPATMILFGFGLLSLTGVGRRRQSCIVKDEC